MTAEVPVTVDVLVAVPAAVRVPVAELVAGDAVLDVWGGSHVLSSVRRLRGGWVLTVRADGWSDSWAAGSVVPVVRAGGAS